MRTALIIPTRNAGFFLDRQLPALAAQTLKVDEFFVVDSSSTDNTAQRYQEAGARVEQINPADFNHSGTRRWASQQVKSELLIYLTQDAIPADPKAFEHLRDELLSDSTHGAAYGRQLPHPGADLLAAQARRFNYPEHSRTKTLQDRKQLGIKTCFSSDSFSIYRREALEAVGGFPERLIGSEDAYVAGKMLQAGWSLRYAASACVEHSHEYRLAEEFRRYFDIGVFYGREDWITQTFGHAGGEGKRFILAEIAALREASALQRIPEVVLRSALKLIGYRLGHLEAHLPTAFKRRISYSPAYWR